MGLSIFLIQNNIVFSLKCAKTNGSDWPAKHKINKLKDRTDLGFIDA